jgi:hypothetical protein
MSFCGIVPDAVLHTDVYVALTSHVPAHEIPAELPAVPLPPVPLPPVPLPPVPLPPVPLPPVPEVPPAPVTHLPTQLASQVVEKHPRKQEGGVAEAH